MKDCYLCTFLKFPTLVLRVDASLLLLSKPPCNGLTATFKIDFVVCNARLCCPFCIFVNTGNGNFVGDVENAGDVGHVGDIEDVNDSVLSIMLMAVMSVMYETTLMSVMSVMSGTSNDNVGHIGKSRFCR